ncbi:MAG: (2Fe-2S) ferredoxin domain-containing protein [Acidobacteriales bacterium]|nr:(2Fe-2S) ferredoxin domain-containing protein [Terriglobales bacterium]
MARIGICMGSSCFARGNAENLGIVRDYVARNCPSVVVSLTGTLCRERCGSGPNITIDGCEYHGVTPDSILELLRRELHAGENP